MNDDRPSPPWVVLLVCGASGVGKSTVARRLAARWDVPLGEADDVCTAVRMMTTPEQEPLLHYWDTHPEAGGWSATKIADLHLSVAESLFPAYQGIIADHVDSAAPVVLEGDYLVPGLVSGFGTAVRAVVTDESDEDQIVANYLAREPEDGEQRQRARVSVEIGARLVAGAQSMDVPVVAARPWEDALDRLDAVLRLSTSRPASS